MKIKSYNYIQTLALPFLISLIIAGCEIKSTQGAENKTVISDCETNSTCKKPADTKTPSTTDATSATYSITFTGDWQASDHTPVTFLPSGAHFTTLIGAAHDSKVSLWKRGEQATPGIENMAETGGTGTLEAEIRNLSNTDVIKSASSNIGRIASETISNIVLTKEKSRISLTTMLAPSPDWFVGVSGLNLYENGQWLETKTVNLLPYSAGTESGTTFTLGGTTRNPHIPIFRLVSGAPDNIFIDGEKIATLTFTKQ